MRRPHLLVASVRPLWPIRGGFPLRAAHLLENLAEDWDITLLLASECDTSAARWPEPARHEIVVVPTPGIGTRPRANQLEALRDRATVIPRDRGSRAALLFPGMELLGDGIAFPRTVADRIDTESVERFRYIRYARKLRGLRAASETVSAVRYERLVTRSVDAVTVAGEGDARALRRVSGSASVWVVPNGVEPQDGPCPELEDPGPTVAFTGTLSYYANSDAVRYLVGRLWPGVRQRIPDARLILAGRGAGRWIRELHGRDGIEVCADVPDMKVPLRRAWISVAPMRCGAGVKNKVLEAWAVGRPVVMTSLGANGVHLDGQASRLVADDPERLIDLMVQLLQDPDLRRRQGTAARSLARERHTWKGAADRMSSLLRGDPTSHAS